MSSIDYIRDHFNSGVELKYAERQVTVSSLTDRCDILKIDTDGFDLRALHGAEVLIREARPLAVQCECHFNGEPLAGDSTVIGVADFLRGYGYTWLDLNTIRYARGALPERFMYRIPANTERGPIGFCDVLFVDDPLAVKGKLTEWLKHSLQRCYKLLAIYDVFGFQDCAAELLVALSRHPASDGKDDWAAMLNIIDPDYETRLASFKADHTQFF